MLVSRGVWRMFRIAEAEYRRTLDAHAVLDFSDVLLRALDLLRQMEEFAQSRYRLESRYHHVLVDEFQDTSRAQWELVSLLVQSWGEGAGLAHAGPLQPSIFIVGDRKQSIYGFRDADVSVLQRGRHVTSRRCGRTATCAGRSRAASGRCRRCSRSSTTCATTSTKAPARRDAFRYDEQDRFPIDDSTQRATKPDTACARALVTRGRHARRRARTIDRRRDRAAASRRAPPSAIATTGVRRSVRAGDIAILFRTRESHREFEDALERRGIAAYVYKGLGFFDADEIKDVLALLWYLAEPLSDLRAAALAALALRPPLGRGAAAAGAAPRRGAAASRATAWSAAPRRRRRCDALRAGACRHRRGGGRWSIGCRRRSCSIVVLERVAPTCSRSAAAIRAGAREPQEDARARPRASRTAATPRSAASRRISIAWPSATRRTR